MCSVTPEKNNFIKSRHFQQYFNFYKYLCTVIQWSNLIRIKTSFFFRTSPHNGNVSWKWLQAQFIIWSGWGESRKRPSLLVVEMGIFFPSLISLWVCSAVSAVSTQKQNSVKALCSLGAFFFQQLAPIPPFPLMNWHAGRNICYYSHFLTACAAWIGSCSGRKQLSGKRGVIRKRNKPWWIISKGRQPLKLIFFVN